MGLCPKCDQNLPGTFSITGRYIPQPVNLITAKFVVKNLQGETLGVYENEVSALKLKAKHPGSKIFPIAQD